MSHHNNTSLIEDGLKLVGGSSGLAVSTLISYGFWYSICKSTEWVSTHTIRFSLSGTEQNELQKVNSSFYNQLAALITSTEIALAGHLSLWPPDQPWWQPLRFVRTGLVVYNTYTTDDPHFIPLIAMTYFTRETVARTVAGACTVETLRHRARRSIQPEDYTYSEYAMVKSVAGLMVATIVYDKWVTKGSSHIEAIFPYLVLASLAETILATGSFSVFNSGNSSTVNVEAEALAESIAGATVGVTGTLSSEDLNLFLFAAAFRTLVLSLPAVESLSGVEDTVLTGVMAGLAIGAGVMDLMLINKPEPDSNHLLSNVAIILIHAFTLALINGFSINALYGVSLEESFFETARNQWKKFYAPLDYLYTLFN
ncbi:hypothetical protein [Endozoicomonas sp. ISHI1]|uniref:hypothetical protein n=1 Tax=Endozoicomonas sp. ISHI1 TaxID=2825882 RepID=UPI002149416F|nr:hypothetical protein [Endozoicomonas sp. ISHI1]